MDQNPHNPSPGTQKRTRTLDKIKTGIPHTGHASPRCLIGERAWDGDVDSLILVELREPGGGKGCQSSERRACILSLGIVCMPRTTGWDLNRNVLCVCSSLLAEFILVGEEMNIAVATKAVGFCRLYRMQKKKGNIVEYLC